MIESVLKEFQYNRGIVYLMLANTIMFAIIGVINLLGNPFFAVIWLAGSVLWGINFLLIKKTPLIRITTQKIIIYRGPLRSPMNAPREQVSMMQRNGKYKLYVVLRDKSQIKISLFGMHKTDKADLVQEIEQFLKAEANHAIHSDGYSDRLRLRR